MTGEDPAATAAVVSDPAVLGSAQAPPALAIFGGLLALVLVSIGTSALLLAGTGRVTFIEPAPTAARPLVAPGTTAAPEAATSSERVRVASTRSESTTTGAGAHRVTFTWTLEGARENDPVEVHFYVGGQLAGRETGTLDASVFSFASGILTLATEQDCSTSGWSADLVSVRGMLVDGDGIAVVPGVACD